MTRTHIITADGTHFIPETSRRRRTRKAIAIVCGIAATPFMAAAAVGIYLGATDPTLGDARPSASPRIASTASKVPAVKLSTARKACKGAPKGSTQACLHLYLQRAYTNGGSYTPAGPALVDECLHQGYTKREVADCLTQEIG